MPVSANLANIRVALKAQSGVGTIASGAGATELDLLPSQGFANQLQTVLSELLDPTRMAGRPRQGSRYFNWSGEAELMCGAQEVPLAAVMGGTIAAAIAFSNVDVTSVTISGTGTVITLGGGSLITLGGRVGGMIQFTNLATGANNSVWVPIISIDATGRIIGIPSGYLVDETIDSAFNGLIARTLITATPYTDSVFTIEHYLPDVELGRALLGADCRFNSVGIDVQPNKKVKLSLGCGSTDLTLLAHGSSPNFTSPAVVSAESLHLVDGGVFVGGVKRVNLSSCSLKLEAPVTGIPLIGTNVSPDSFLGQFKLTGQIAGVIQDGTDFDAWKAETLKTLILHCKEQSTQNFITIAATNAAYGSWSMPAAGEGPAIQTIPVYAGKDKRGIAAGYAPTTLLFSFS
jgi:hypothetical protein